MSQTSSPGGVPRDATIAWIKRLIAYDTTSRHSNLGLIEAVRDSVKQLGLQPVLSYDADKFKANLFVTIPASAGSAHRGSLAGGIVLSGHTDVVPVDDQSWDSPPFSGDIRDGRLYGRGSCDMKGFIGTVLAALPSMLAMRLPVPIHIALTYDEEVGCRGVRLLLEDLRARGVHPGGCIIGEPTGMQAIVAHKGIALCGCSVRGRPGHSSRTSYGVNAIEYAAEMITHICRIAGDFETDGPFDRTFDIPYATAQTGIVRGGIGVTTIPEDCMFDFEYRCLPGMNEDEVFAAIRHHAESSVLPRMRKRYADAGLELHKHISVPAFEADENHAMTRLVRRLTADQTPRKVAYGTEAGLFQMAGIPTIVCGPGDIAQAHQPDEFISLAQIAACERFLDMLFESLVHSGRSAC